VIFEWTLFILFIEQSQGEMGGGAADVGKTSHMVPQAVQTETHTHTHTHTHRLHICFSTLNVLQVNVTDPLELQLHDEITEAREHVLGVIYGKQQREATGQERTRRQRRNSRKERKGNEVAVKEE
jgi:hypothetical protein